MLAMMGSVSGIVKSMGTRAIYVPDPLYGRLQTMSNDTVHAVRQERTVSMLGPIAEAHGWPYQ